ncbi:MAG: leucine-rich repeat domain-containing protein [Clostridia bacterium]|nr:leucine-rich repeat domain-containing protein [Clostridia bacterium]
MKKYLAIAMAALLLAFSLVSCVGKTGDGIGDYTPEVDYLVTDQGTFYFEEAEGETAILVNYVGKATKDDHVVIPATFNDRTVTTIGKECFSGLASVVGVEIPATVTKIDYQAFAGCTELTEVVLPDGLLEIGKEAFANCTSLTSVSFGKSLEAVDAYAFWKCGSLTTLSFPATLKTIGDGAFWMCSGLTAVELPATMEKIGELAFYHCYNLKDVALPEGAEIGDYVFAVDEKDTGVATEEPTAEPEA